MYGQGIEKNREIVIKTFITDEIPNLIEDK